jgi:hypothetical protein
VTDTYQEGEDPVNDETMTVTVRDTSVEAPWGYGLFRPVTRPVTISAFCPTCGERRGTPRKQRNAEDGVSWWTDVWDNPCGHNDMYTSVILEARGRGTLGLPQSH